MRAYSAICHSVAPAACSPVLWSSIRGTARLVAARTWRGGCSRHKPRHHTAADVQRQAVVPAGQLLSHGLHLAVAGQLTGCQDCSPRLTGSSKQVLLKACIDVSLITGCPGIAWMIPPGQAHRSRSAVPTAAGVVPRQRPRMPCSLTTSLMTTTGPRCLFSFDCSRT